jgi:multiple sugar transport system substrate-binding protein
MQHADMPERNKYLRIAVRKFDPFESALEKQWNAFCRKTGCTLLLEAVPMELPRLHQTTLVDGGLENGQWDIAQISTDWLPEARAAGATEDLAPYIEKLPPGGYPEDWPDSLLYMQTGKNEIAGLPFHDGPECLIYRKDLFADHTHQQRFSERFGKPLKPPDTWEDFLQIAVFFHRPDVPFYGAVLAAYPDGHNLVFDFCLQLWTHGGQLTDQAGRVCIYSPAAERGLACYRELMQHPDAMHPGCRDFDSVRAGMAFARGEAAMTINWFGFAAFAETADTPVKGNTAIAPIPSGTGGAHVSLISYWLYMIGKGSQHKALAYDFIRFAVNQENDKLLTLEGGVGCRLSTCRDEEINRVIPFYHQLAGLHAQARGLPAIKQWPEIAGIIDELMTKTIDTTLPLSLLLQEGQQAIDKIK